MTGIALFGKTVQLLTGGAIVITLRAVIWWTRLVLRLSGEGGKAELKQKAAKDTKKRLN